MTPPHVLLQIALASTALAKPLLKPYNTRSTPSKIEWGPCGFETAGALPVECGSLSVPLDYSDPSSSRTLNLELLRSRAIQTPSKGSILFNFGGPGYETIHTLDAVTALLHNKTGGQHDLIGFNPRGLAKTLKFSCFDTPQERAVANYKYPILAIPSSDVALVDTWANSQAISNICYNKNKDTDRAELIGTTSVARDMMQIVDALDEDGLLRFWGFSYGTLLGETVAAMFPDRMDRLILDGVVNAFNYYRRFGIDVDQLLSADAAFRAVLSECISAGPTKCALAADVNTTSPSPSAITALETRLETLAQTYKHAPLAVNTTIINLTFVKTLIFTTIKYTSDVTNSLRHIHNLLHSQNLTAVADYYNLLERSIALGDDDAILGIRCGDLHTRAESLEGIMPDVERYVETSEIFGGYIAGVAAQCAPWKFKSKEMFDTGVLTAAEGGVKTRNPILFIGNTYDPATPVVSARNMSGYFVGSVVLEQRGFGHTTLSQASDCTDRITREYMIDGILPEDGEQCEVDVSLF